MHDKYADKGLVVISVNFDKADDKEMQTKVLEFLQAKKATFTNLVLDEPPDYWSQKLHFTTFPCIFVFNREGKWTQFSGDNVDHDEIEKLVKQLLDKK
jgi:hypothetical protein